MEKKFQPQDIAALLAQQQGISTEEALNFVRTFFELTEEALVNDRLVKVSGFGTTKLVVVNERESVNIHTGERFQIGKHTKITFTPDNTLRDLVNSPFALLTTTTLYNETPEEELDAVPVVAEGYAEEAIETAPLKNAVREDAGNSVFPEDKTPFEDSNVPMDTAQSEEISEKAQEATSVTPQVASPDVHESPNIAETIATKQPKVEPTFSEALSIPANTTTESPETATALSAPNATTVEENTTTIEATGESLDVIPEIVIAEAPIVEEAVQNESPEVYVNPISLEATVAPSPAQAEETLLNVTNIQGEIHVKTEEVGNKAHHNRTRFNILLFAFVILLLILSYFAGYYHWLCPNCPQTHSVITTSALVTSHDTNVNLSPQTVVNKAEIPAATTKDSVNKTIVQASSIAETTTTSSPTEAEKSTSTQCIILKGSQLTAQEKETFHARSRNFQQMRHGKSMIVGTYLTHVVKTGESLPRLSKLYYGSPNYANYIILHNHIDDPDLIKVGQRIKIPQLVHE